MIQNKQVHLLFLTALMLFLVLLACSLPPTLMGQATTEPPGEEQATATTELETTEAPIEEPTQAPTDVAEVLTQVLYDHDHISNGLLLDNGGDVDTEVVSIGNPPEQALRTGNGGVIPSADGNKEEDFYMQFRVDDGFIYRGSPTSRLRIEVEYLDQGTDTFSVQYDATSGGPEGDGRFKDSGVFVKTNSGEFRTAVFPLDDAYFGNRTNGGDFRIADSADGAEIIRRVVVTLVTATPEPPTTATKEAPEAAEGADIVFHNGILLTQNGDQPQAQAIAIQGGKILAVGDDADILALQGPGTRVVDLAGRTLLPGFVDGHTHILVFASQVNRTLDEAQDIALSYGFTTLTEMWADGPSLDELMLAEQSGQLRLRVNAFATYNDGILQNGEKVFVRAWYPENDPILDTARMLRIPGIKVFVDGGSGGGRGCPALSEPYEPDFVATDWFRDNCGGDRGDLYWSQEEINQVVADAQAAGYRVAFHAMGDRGIETALDAIETALDGQPNERYRHQIEHNSLLRPDLLERYVKLDVLASLRGTFNTCEQSDYPTYYGPHRFEWAAKRYTLPGLGVHAYLETDYGWTADPADAYAVRNLNPILHLYGLVTRQQVNQDGTICEPEPWLAPHGISVEGALRIMTIEPAYAVSLEDVIGSLEPGKYADLVILSADPMAVDPNTIKDLEVWMTMVGGKTEYCAPGQEGLCP